MASLLFWLVTAVLLLLENSLSLNVNKKPESSQWTTRQNSNFPCANSENLRIRCGFVHNGSVYLFGDHGRSTDCWLVRLKPPTGDDRWYTVDPGFPQREKDWRDPNTGTFSGFRHPKGCPKVSVFAGTSLYIFTHDDNVRIFQFFKDKFYAHFYEPLKRSKFITPLSKVFTLQPISATTVKLDKPVFLVKLLLQQNPFHRMRSLQTVNGTQFMTPSTMKYPPSKEVPFITELAMINVTSKSSYSFGYQFLERLSIPSAYFIDNDYFSNYLATSSYRETALLQGPLTSKTYNLSNPWVAPKDLPYLSYIVPLESWFGCPLDRFCLMHQIDGVVRRQGRILVFLDKHLYSVSTMKDRLVSPDDSIHSLFGISSFVDAVIGIPSDNATRLYIFKDDTFIMYDYDTNMTTTKQTSKAFKQTQRVMAVFNMENRTNIGYFYERAKNVTTVTEYEDIHFEIYDSTLSTSSKTISEVDSILPSFVDTVFHNETHVLTLIGQFYVSQDMETYYNKQYRGTSYRLIANSGLFGCQFDGRRVAARNALSSYEERWTPVPADPNVVVIQPIAVIVTTAESPTQDWLTPVSSQTAKTVTPGRPDVIESVRPTPSLFRGANFLILLGLGVGTFLGTGLAIGFGINYLTRRKVDVSKSSRKSKVPAGQSFMVQGRPSFKGSAVIRSVHPRRSVHQHRGYVRGPEHGR